MSEQNKAIIRRFLESFDRGDLAEINDMVIPDYVDHTPVPGQPARVEGLNQLLATFRAAFPDLHVTIEDMIAEGDKVAVRNTFHGTHKGKFMGIAPTNRPISITRVDIMRIIDGKVAERWGFMDEPGTLRQLRAMDDDHVELDALHG